MKNLQAIKVGCVVNVSHKGTFFKKVFDNELDALEFFKKVIHLKENYSEETFERDFKVLITDRKLVDVGYGLEVDENSGNYFLNGIGIPIPKQLEDIIWEYKKENLPFEAIINFWNLLLLNPFTKVRESLFDYLSHYQLMINDDGYFVGYKAVRKVTKQKLGAISLDSLDANKINTEYLKIKRWKKSPKKMVVVYDKLLNKYTTVELSKVQDGTFSFENKILIGNNLEEAYNMVYNSKEVSAVETSESYTDKYTGTMEIVIGKPVTMDVDKCDTNPDNDCSKGLHVGSPSYVKGFANSDDEILICLVNPMNVVSVPKYNTSKLRCSEYIPVGIAELKDKEIKTIEGSYYEGKYLTYEKESIEKLVTKLKEENDDTLLKKYSISVDDLLKLYNERMVKISG